MENRNSRTHRKFYTRYDNKGGFSKKYSIAPELEELGFSISKDKYGNIRTNTDMLDIYCRDFNAEVRFYNKPKSSKLSEEERSALELIHKYYPNRFMNKGGGLEHIVLFMKSLAVISAIWGFIIL